jgi:hypothetical protein
MLREWHPKAITARVLRELTFDEATNGTVLQEHQRNIYRMERIAGGLTVRCGPNNGRACSASRMRHGL